LTDHWNSWVTQSDLQKIKDAGLNSVRIPIGFWSVEQRLNEPYVNGQIPVLQKVLGWLKDIGLTALIDLHGVVAGQSANTNTGHQQDREYWTQYDADHVITLRMLGKLTQAITPYLQANGGPVIGIGQQQAQHALRRRSIETIQCQQLDESIVAPKHMFLPVCAVVFAHFVFPFSLFSQQCRGLQRA
jgi:hypothetical protein